MRDVMEFIVREAASDSAVDRGEASGMGDVGSGFGTADMGSGLSDCIAWELQ